MAERYQDRPFPDQVRGGDPQGSGRGEGDPLAELARLIGQSDPFGNTGRGNPQVPPRTAPPRNQYQPPEGLDDPLGTPRPPWIQRANRQELPRELQRELPRGAPRESTREAPIEGPRELPSEVMREAPRQVQREAEAVNYPAPSQPLNRYGAQHPEPEQEQDYQQEPPFDDAEGEPDPARYDDALYGQIGSGVQNYQREQGFPDDPFGYQDDYEEEEEDQGERRRGGLKTVVAVLVLAVLGTGAALGYRAYFGSSRNGEPPIIRADNSPTKVVPPTDGTAKVPDRLGSSDGSEKIVPREEAPVDINTRAIGPRVVFPPLNQNGNPPSPASVSPSAGPSGAPVVVPSSGMLANNEPRKVKTLSVRGGDQPDGTAAPAGAMPAPAPPKSAAAAKPPRNPPSSANASATGPLSLSPQGADSASMPAAAATPRAKVAATNPTQTEPDSGAASSGSSGGYMVQVSSQPSESVAQASYKTLQTKFPAVLGSHDAVIQRADLADKRVVYRAMVGPFGSREEALQLCTTLKTAGGQCFVPKN
jgi:SPOR domain